MATTTLLQRHAGEGETIAEAIRDCLDYGKDPEKTESGKYISAYECDPATVADEFLLAKASYAAMTGREQKKENNVLCYQIRQSFYPGEITPKEANRIGYELAMRWTKGRHAFIVTTHTDKQHIHCHIYYNSTTLDYTRKFRNFWGSSFALRRLSDRLCLENGLSIVENPKPRSKGKFRNYGEWQAGQKKPLTYQDRLRAAIDTALAKKPADFPAFLSLMEQAGYEVKQRRGAISFRAPGQERFTRLRSDTLGEGYSETDIRAALSGSRQRPGQPRQKINLAIDIQSRLQGKGPSYERWAKVFNLKQMAAALAYLQDNGLTDYEQLEQKATAATEHFHKLSDQIKSTEAALHTNMELKAATVQYAKTRPVFEKYKASKYSKKFLAEHEADIELYRAACADFKAILGGAKLPKMDTLKEEGRKLSEQKKKLYAEYRKTKADMQEVTTIKANIDYLLGYSEPGRKKEQER
ncbi:MAG: relaxase/mobilization nuclease domain-containing protein [Faecalibacterium sp.]|uniref:relaxase/mobilization nuclease domain-containing protein n=2 Tax=Faecalibacterium sp. TaxID=1971605 RepID=UPI003992B63E